MGQQYRQFADKYKLINKIASGSFGEVYLTLDKSDNKYASKVEDKNSRSRLLAEYKIYKNLQKNGMNIGIPHISDFIETQKQNILVMQLLGKDLDELHKGFKSQFNLNTVLKLGIAIITLLEQLHNVGFIHRDIKPNNFLTGYDDIDNIYIMDFGLSKQFINNGKHIDLKVERELIGTARYASINIHLGFEPSRRDDLESVGYMLIYFLNGKLPWQGLKEKKGENKIKMIGECKMSTNLNKLCYNLPECFIKYIKYCRNLKFEEKPDYEYLKALFNNCQRTENINLEYCWNK
jgi:serine/threonine protein kinase